MPLVTRFAPSPTGYLHQGHALSALTAWHIAQEKQGRFLLRIEDIDPERCRPEYEAAIYEDLAWLGLKWEEPVRRQSEHMADYAAALEMLKAKGLIYPCFCSRRDIAEAAHAASPDINNPHGALYPGTCKKLLPQEIGERLARGESPAWRLDMEKAKVAVAPLTWFDLIAKTVSATPEIFGDVVLARKDTPTSYHLSVVVDDFLQGVNLVIRGQDLFEATHIHRLLQALLGFEPVAYYHHQLLLDQDGKKLSKRDGAKRLSPSSLSG
jgi:glutamyl-Q tRNA(Asp) synthetase